MNKSPQRDTFQINNMIKHVENGTKSAEAAEEMIDFYKSHILNNPRVELKLLHFFINTGINDNG